jgi:hypothetical protein
MKTVKAEKSLSKAEENHYSTTFIISDSGKNHQGMLKLVGNGLKSNRICTKSQTVSPQDT